ncbi:hypothetical protein [Pseudomonas sp.]|uniref:hypothetical protein n=1 Tax=Pseudomonas sp. TaxID=306 RepID=UPI0026194BE7|nr:hypothetical protein [Pseudomonas sp.]
MMTVTTEWHGDRVAAAVRAAVPAAVNHAAELLRGWSVEAAPVLDGTLRASAQVTAATAGDPTAHVSFDTVYAWRQHEELTWNHPGGGGAKYLEGPLLEHHDDLLAAMAARIKGAIGG